jgi:hypothetical protein
LVPYPRSVPRHNPVWALRTVPSTSRLGFCSDMHCQLRDLIETGVCLSKSSCRNSKQVVETCQGWSILSLIAKCLNAYVSKVFLI